jgi:hypothetical protein
MLRHAFKEWAVICRALAEGKQAIILRKGGITEEGGSFRVEHDRFWLYPTYVHQQKGGIQAAALPLLEQAEAKRPPPGIVRLTHFAELAQVCHLADLDVILRLQDLHCWSEETVHARFAYRKPGLFVLAVRVYRAADEHDLAETAEYAGCKSWVELDRELPTEGATGVLDSQSFDDVLQVLRDLRGIQT